jgi:hypothetical protein
MSYDPNLEGYTEFLWAYDSDSQTLSPTRNGSVTIDNYGITITLDSYRSTNTGASLTSNELFTNNSRAFWCGDMRVNALERRRTQFCLEFETNELIRNAANQDEGAAAVRDDVCYGVSSRAKMKVELCQKITGSTTAPFSRVLGMVLST